MDYKVTVIGAGPGGYTAAIRAAQLGAKVCLVEKSEPGGVCLNRGCIPTKTLLKSAQKWQELQHCEAYGLSADNISFDFAKVSARKQAVVKQLRDGVIQLVKSNKIELKTGFARLVDAHTIEVDGSQFSSEYIILATGSAASTPPIPGTDLPGVLNSDALLELDKVPASMLIVGAGVVGVEFAGIFSAFGTAITLVEMAPSILPGSDTDIPKRLGPTLRKQGIKTLTSAKVLCIEQEGSQLCVTVECKGKTEQIKVEKVLLASGRMPVVQGLGLENAAVEFTAKGIAVNSQLQTNIANIYAIGDLTNKLMLAHVASQQAMIAAEHIAGLPVSMSYNVVPACIFTSPEIACVGLTEQEAAAKNIAITISKFNFAGNGKAISMGETDGLVKIIADATTHQVLGMHILGAHASDLIMEGALAIKHSLTAQQLAHTIHPHPTLSETILEAAHGIFGDIIHQVKLK